MVHSCAAYNCTERYKKDSGITFHEYPHANPKLLEAWTRNTNRDKWTPTRASKLCSKHFTDNSFECGRRLKRRLKPDAVPTIFDYPKHLSKKMRLKGELKKPSLPLQRRNRKRFVPAKLTDSQFVTELVPKENVVDGSGEGSVKHLRTVKQNADQLYPDPQTLSQNMLQNVSSPSTLQMIPAESGQTKKESPPYAPYAPYADHLYTLSSDSNALKDKFDMVLKRKELQIYASRRKVSVLSRACEMQKVRIEKMKETIKNLKTNQCANEPMFRVIQDRFSDVSRDLFHRLLSSNPSAEFTETLWCFAQTLLCYSPVAYDLVRNSLGKFSLPHKATLRKKMAAGQPDLTQEQYAVIEAEEYEAFDVELEVEERQAFEEVEEIETPDEFEEDNAIEYVDIAEFQEGATLEEFEDGEAHEESEEYQTLQESDEDEELEEYEAFEELEECEELQKVEELKKNREQLTRIR